MSREIGRLFVLNNLSWPLRMPIKVSIFFLTVVVVCFPYPNRLARHIQRWQNPNALIDPTAVALAPLIEELEPVFAEPVEDVEKLKAVEALVLKRVPYDWDWNTWGMADYLPSVTETLEKSREDCDGRAVVAASLLAHFGYEPAIVTDFAHVWVKTNAGEVMGPGKQKALVATKDGLRWRAGALAQLPRALAFGLAVFPLLRELMIVAVFWLLMLRPHGGGFVAVVALVFLLAGLFCLRAGGATYLRPSVWLQWVGLASWGMSGWCLLGWARSHAGNRLLNKPSESFLADSKTGDV